MRTETTDICVIGSGAAGAVVAHHAASQGRGTLILERGPYVRGQDMSHEELKMLPTLYKDGGLQLNTSMNLFILQGSCVGGSTVLANNVLFRAKDAIFDDWQRLGAVFDRDALTRSYQRVETALGASTPPPAQNVSSSSHLLMKGARELGMDGRWMTKALGNCTGCGGCNIGCVFDHKRSTLTTYIPWAEQKGARVLAETTVEKIVHKKGRVMHLLATQGKDKRPLRVIARQVVVACGAIGSSALLLKSGLKGNVGKRVSFNLGAAVIAEFPEPIDAFDGDQMSVYVQGDGYTIEPVHNPPGAASLMTPGWFEDHWGLMQRYRHLAFAGSLVGTQAVGRVVQSPFFGHEETRFQMPDEDLLNVTRGLKAASRAFFAAGAQRMILPTHTFQTIERPEDVGRMDSALGSTRNFDLGSSHPQGGNAWSEDPALGVVDKDLGVHGFENLFVCDASVFPSCIRVNPINTIMAVADYAAPRILARG